MKILSLLAVGLVAGYFYGFNDAQTHTQPVHHRVAEQVFNRAGGASRERVSGDVDARMQRADRQ